LTAFEGFFESTAQDIAPFNIQTTLVEPGGARTGFFSSNGAVYGPALPEYARPLSPYKRNDKALPRTGALAVVRYRVSSGPKSQRVLRWVPLLSSTLGTERVFFLAFNFGFWVEAAWAGSHRHGVGSVFQPYIASSNSFPSDAPALSRSSYFSFKGGRRHFLTPF
jgi:hypothetical protein